jgi:uncharacterized protein (TIGR00369 family)
MEKSEPIDGTVMSGLEYLKAAFSTGETSARGIDRTLCFRGVEAESGRVVFRAEPNEDHYNPVGIVQGGYSAALLDAVTGCAVHSVLPAGARYATTDLRITFLHPITKSSSPLRAEGALIHAGKKIALAEGSIFDAKGRLCARGSATCMIMSPSHSEQIPDKAS